jgi:hypothetical protein
MTLKPDSFRALGVKTPLKAYRKKGYEAKLALNTTLTIPNFLTFDANTHCLMRQEAQLLNKSLRIANTQ